MNSKKYLARENALHALIGGETQEQAAAVAGVTVRSINRWLLEPDFSQALNAGRALVRNRILSRLAGKGEAAVLTLASLMASGASENVRRLAAVNILELLDRYQSIVEFEDRLTALEQRINRGADE